MLQFPYEIHDLGNGLNLLAVPIKNAPAVTVAIFTGVGSRYETDAQAGIAHIFEHMAFKGTTNRPTRRQIDEEIAMLGGESNAATGHEFTYYYVKTPAYHWEKALDIVSDLLLHSTFPADELAKEEQVIVQEYMMYEDNPHRKLGADFRAQIWPNHPLGRKIEGTPDTILAITRDDLLTFQKEYYVRNNMLIAIGGDFDVSKAVSLATEYFQAVPNDRIVTYQEVGDLQPSSHVQVTVRAQEAVDLAVGFKGITRKQQHELDILNVLIGVFGSGSHSRLFRHVRDELGLTYYIGAGHMDFQDDGLFVVRAGVAKDKVEVALRAILQECRLMTEELVGEHELKLAKEYLKGKMLLELETTDSVLEYYAFQQLLEPSIRTPRDIVEKIDSITAADIATVAKEVFKSGNIYAGLLGPVNESSGKIQELLTI